MNRNPKQRFSTKNRWCRSSHWVRGAKLQGRVMTGGWGMNDSPPSRRDGGPPWACRRMVSMGGESGAVGTECTMALVAQSVRRRRGQRGVTVEPRGNSWHTKIKQRRHEQEGNRWSAEHAHRVGVFLSPKFNANNKVYPKTTHAFSSVNFRKYWHECHTEIIKQAPPNRRGGPP